MLLDDERVCAILSSSNPGHSPGCVPKSDRMSCEYLAIRKVDTPITVHTQDLNGRKRKGRNENPATPGPHARRVVLWPVKPKVQGSTGVRWGKGDCSWRRARAACW
eukprot:scaffold18597_cov63-Phaeocystis_antarctica.AAC.9